MNAVKTAEVKNDRVLMIATALSRRSIRWTNEEILWSDLVARLEQTTRTRETVTEYKKMPKGRRDDIKDVGGFVGGTLKGGRRKAENLANRHVVTLDLDDVATTVEDVWDAVTILYGCELVLYSTHSHTVNKPRLRLVVPLARPVFPDEYQAIGRKMASEIGLDMFDPTTFEPVRLMYWPSTPADGEYVFLHQPGDLLDPNPVLDSYQDWRDVSQWPSPDRLAVDIQGKMKRQEDPLEKGGLVGAFCRTYTIHEVIDKYLPDVYTEAGPGRYSYAKGSTTGGLVVYEDKFAYSHHGTDPTSGMLCNAFDLVRIHLYGELDAEAKEGTPANRLPSYTKMVAVAGSDPAVKETLGRDHLRATVEDFDFQEAEDGEEDATAWLSRLSYDKKGAVENTIQNALLVLEHDPRVAGRFRYDAFANRALVTGPVPWAKSVRDHDWSDTDDSGLRHFLETNYGLTVAYKIDDAKNLVFDRHKVHPVREYLQGLEWDGVSRIETLFVDYLGAEDSIYTREVAVCHMVAAVKRVMEPGSKHDEMITLVGPQGIGKSTLIKKLGRDWYSDSLDTMKGKEAAELIQGVWLVELSELNATRKADRDAVKSFLSKQEDIYRVAYAKNTSRFPRQCIFWGTTNDNRFLRDPTGDRRTWPVDCHNQTPTKSVWDDLTEDEVDRLWAEAYALYQSGASTRLGEEASAMAVKKQEEHQEDTPLSGLIEAYLDMDFPANWDAMDIMERRQFIRGDTDGFTEGTLKYRKDRTCVLEIWCELLGNSPGKLQPINSREISDILRGLPGWKSAKGNLSFGKNYGKQRGFLREQI